MDTLILGNKTILILIELLKEYDAAAMKVGGINKEELRVLLERYAQLVKAV